MAAGTLRYWAAARAAAGVDEDPLDADTLASVIAAAVSLHADRPQLAKVLSICAYIVNGAPAGTRPQDLIPLGDAWLVEALPPFAGG